MDLISVIIPVYNIAAYLRKCVDSVRRQSYQNLEIILIDDGSTDGSGELCDELGQLDFRIIVLHQEHRLVGAARNYGLDTCCGRYICFVDGDDYISDHMIEVLYDKLQETNADVVSCQLARIDLVGSVLPHKVFDGIKEYTDYTEYLMDIYVSGQVPAGVVGKLYKQSVFEFFRYSPTFRSSDLDSWIDLSRFIHKIIFLKDYLYFYVTRPGSITHPEQYSYGVVEGIVNCKRDIMWHFFRELPELNKLGEAIYYNTLVVELGKLYFYCDMAYHNEMEIMQQEIRTHLRKSLFNPYITTKQKLGYILAAFHIGMYGKVYQWYIVHYIHNRSQQTYGQAFMDAMWHDTTK